MSFIKRLAQRIDWDVVTAIVIVGTVPLMIIIGAIFFPFFTPYYGE